MNVQEIVTEKIIAMLEAGTVPWRRPWKDGGMPCNIVSKKPYRGINYFLLSASKYVSPHWMTFKQAQGLGGNVRKGEHGTMIVFWKTDAVRDPDAHDGEISSKDRTRFVLRYYLVFNLEQCELPQAVLDKLPKLETRQNDPIDAAESIVAAMPDAPEIQYAGTKAFYSSMTDRVTLPPREIFSSAEEYYATAFHELSHSTGHARRLDRESIREACAFGSAIYSKEELIAEMSAAFVCAEAGISPVVIENQAAYIAGWLSKLRSDARLIVMAAAAGQKAADCVLGRNLNQQAIAA
jgi:antirestriction protein ArdC